MTKPLGSGDRVNAAVARGKFTFLSGETCLAGRGTDMRETRNRLTRMNKSPAYPIAAGGYEPPLKRDTKQAVTHERFPGASDGDIKCEGAGVSRGHSSFDDESEGPNAAMRKDIP